MSDWALEHEIYCAQRYGQIVRAAGVDPERLDSLTLFELAGHIEDDAEVKRLYFAAAGDNATLTGMSLAQCDALLVRILSEMKPTSRRAMAERAVSKLNVPEKILTSR